MLQKTQPKCDHKQERRHPSPDNHNGGRADAPLTAADVVRFLQAGISEPTILLELQNRDFGEPLDPPREAALREAGASETLIVAIRRVAPVPPAPSPPGPGV
jgi:hypothetical protein